MARSKIALIGAGGQGTRDAQNAANWGDVLAVCDVDRTHAEAAHGPVDLAVITIPANFTNAAREATLEAARRAGFAQVHMINEPTAAALAYARGQIAAFKAPRRLAFVDALPRTDTGKIRRAALRKLAAETAS